MNKDIKFGFFKDGFNPKVSEFNKNLLVDISKGYGTFVQLLVNGEDYVRSGNLPHATLLKFSLDEFRLECGFKPDLSGYQIPLAKSEGIYELVGAGKIKIVDDLLNFHETSMDYKKEISGTNLPHLERMFGKENISKVKWDPTSYLVKI